MGGSRDLSRSRSFVLSTFAIGLAVTFMLLGVIAALIGGVIGAGPRWWYYLVALVCFLIGLICWVCCNFAFPLWFGGLRERIGFEGFRRGRLLLGLVSGLVALAMRHPWLRF